MWVRKRIDLSWFDLASGLWSCASRFDTQRAAHEVQGCWACPDQIITCLSVRSGLDLLWRALALPPGSEVLVSALTIRDMAAITAEHGLVPLPVDLDLRTLAVNVESLERAITPRTRAVLVAHLFGSRTSLSPFAELVRRHRLLVIEDCAQAYEGTGWSGDPLALVSLFSFGTIKTCTALGGAVLRVTDNALASRVRALQAAAPGQSRTAYLLRLLKYGLLKLASTRAGCRVLFEACSLTGTDYDLMLNRAVRGFDGPGFLDRIRKRPAAPLLALLARRLRQDAAARIAERTRVGRFLAERLRHRFELPGDAAGVHSYWVFPVMVENPLEVISAMRQAGFDATQGTSMSVVPTPADRSDLFPVESARALAKTIYLPCYAGLGESAAAQMADVLLSTAEGGPRTSCAAQGGVRVRAGTA
jgi:dTDP-4-amino-4,6-dideoxygalactose transaminase